MRAIMVQTMDAIAPGMYITEPDSDYPLESIVPDDDYLADEQDWQHVLKRHGYVDLPTFVLAYHDGTPYTQKIQSSATVWVLVEKHMGAWVPVEQDPNE